MVAAALAVALGFTQYGPRLPIEKPVRPEFYLPPSRRPTLSEISMRVVVLRSEASSSNTVTFPVPSDYSGQTVIGFKVTCSPPTALKSWSRVTRPDGLNSVVNIALYPGAGSATVGYQAQCVTPPEGVVRLQRKNYRDWLASSIRVQSTDPEIAALSKRLQIGTKSRDEIVGRVVKWVAGNKMRQDLTPGRSDAKTALFSGGDSLGRANLCAAILRAGLVPASVVAAIPAWAERMEAESWIVECWTDDGNWQMVDPTVGIQSVARNSEIVLAISSVTDENQDISDQSTARADAPKLSIPEVSSNLSISRGSFATTLHVIRSFPPQSGPRLMIAAHRRTEKVFQSAGNGQDSWIEDAILQRVLKRGPINLALYLDGQPTLANR